MIHKPFQGNLFAEEEMSVTYILIATNRMESEENAVTWYNQQRDQRENRIKELKISFSIERMPYE